MGMLLKRHYNNQPAPAVKPAGEDVKTVKGKKNVKK